MARTNTLTNFLTDVANAIKVKREYPSSQKILAEDFDTEISNIESGTDTSDATAVANDIAYPKTAYIATGKTTGNMLVPSSEYYSECLQLSNDILGV